MERANRILFVEAMKTTHGMEWRKAYFAGCKRAKQYILNDRKSRGLTERVETEAQLERKREAGRRHKRHQRQRNPEKHFGWLPPPANLGDFEKFWNERAVSA